MNVYFELYEKNNNNACYINNNVLGYFKRNNCEYSVSYDAIKNFTKSDISYENICKSLCDIFMAVAEIKVLNQFSYSIIKLLLAGKFAVNGFTVDENLEIALEDFLKTILSEFEDHNEFLSFSNNQVGLLGVNSNVVTSNLVIPDTQQPTLTNDIQNQRLQTVMSLANNQLGYKSKDKSFSNPSLEISNISNFNQLTSFINSVILNVSSNISKYMDEKSKNFAKLVNSNNTVKAYYDRISVLSKDICHSNNQLKLLGSYKRAKSTPASLNHYRFPKPMFNRSKNDEYFKQYNFVVETCQFALMDLNMNEFKLRIEKNKGEIESIVAILSISIEKVYEKIKSIENSVRKNLENSFKAINEEYECHSLETVLIFPFVKLKKIKCKFKYVKQKPVRKKSNKVKKTPNSNRSNSNTNNIVETKTHSYKHKNKQNDNYKIDRSRSRPTIKIRKNKFRSNSSNLHNALTNYFSKKSTIHNKPNTVGGPNFLPYRNVPSRTVPQRFFEIFIAF